MGKAKLISTNPATGQLIKEYQQHGPQEVGNIIQGAGKAWEKWSTTGFGKRSELMSGAAAILRADIDKYAGIITGEGILPRISLMPDVVS